MQLVEGLRRVKGITRGKLFFRKLRQRAVNRSGRECLGCDGRGLPRALSCVTVFNFFHDLLPQSGEAPVIPVP